MNVKSTNQIKEVLYRVVDAHFRVLNETCNDIGILELIIINTCASDNGDGPCTNIDTFTAEIIEMENGTWQIDSLEHIHSQDPVDSPDDEVDGKRKQLFCMICKGPVEIVDEYIVETHHRIMIECLTCSDHLVATIGIPTSVRHLYLENKYAVPNIETEVPEDYNVDDVIPFDAGPESNWQILLKVTEEFDQSVEVICNWFAHLDTVKIRDMTYYELLQWLRHPRPISPYALMELVRRVNEYDRQTIKAYVVQLREHIIDTILDGVVF